MRDSHLQYTGGRGIAEQFAQSLLAGQGIALVCLELLLYIYQQQWGIPGLSRILARSSGIRQTQGGETTLV